MFDTNELLAEENRDDPKKMWRVSSSWASHRWLLSSKGLRHIFGSSMLIKPQLESADKVPGNEAKRLETSMMVILYCCQCITTVADYPLTV